MSDLRQGVSRTTHAILDIADAISATDHAMPQDGRYRTFERAQMVLSMAADPATPDLYRRANVGLAAAILIAIANQLSSEADARSTDMLAKLGYRR